MIIKRSKCRVHAVQIYKILELYRDKKNWNPSWRGRLTCYLREIHEV